MSARKLKTVCRCGHPGTCNEGNFVQFWSHVFGIIDVLIRFKGQRSRSQQAEAWPSTAVLGVRCRPSFTTVNDGLHRTPRTAVDGHPPAVTLTFDLLTSKSTHLWSQIHPWPKLDEIPFIDFWDMAFTRFSGRTDSRTNTAGFSAA